MTSDTMPKLGRMMMYTSGCPKIQNRCCHSSGSAPSSGSKKLAPKSRSNSSRNRATVMTGRAKSKRNWVTSVIQVRDRHPQQCHARRPHVEHGDDQVDRTEQRRDAGDQQAERVEVDAVGRREGDTAVRCDSRTSHRRRRHRRTSRCSGRVRRRATPRNDSALSRGKATSRAPIWSGSR